MRKGYVTLLTVSSVSVVLLAYLLLTNSIMTIAANEVIDNKATMQEYYDSVSGYERVKLASESGSVGEITYEDINKTYVVNGTHIETKGRSD